ncbi:MAG TPA: hypothetical protein VHN80_01585 [Kineosporiaceae bacterium]|jgi:carbon-monoxide dehydrogenase small subunit|nr:hypothetical protein [Kineosporiaceae bacterium]
MRVTMTVKDAALEADDVWEGASLLYVLPAPACACLIAAGQAQGRDVRTPDPGEAHPVQAGDPRG